MNDTKDLLRKIAALRQRLSPAPAAPAEAVGARIDPAHAVLEQVEQGGWHNRLIDRSLRPLVNTLVFATLAAAIHPNLPLSDRDYTSEALASNDGPRPYRSR